MNQTQTEFDTTAICIVTNNNEEDTKIFIDNLLNTTKGNYQLYIYDYQSRSKCFLDYLANVCLNSSGYFKSIVEETKLSTIYNMFIEDAKQQFIAIVNINTILDHNWLAEVLYYHKNIQNSGCVGIRSQEDDVELRSTLFHNISKDEDEMKTIWMKQLNVIDTPIFFEKSKVIETGSIYENFKNRGFELNEFSFRFMAMGYVNYYIRNNTCLKTFVENQFLLPHKTKQGSVEFKMKINKMVKSYNFK
jgi:hypothetical protein